MDTKYPLAIPVKAGMDVIKKFKLRSETSLRDDIKNYQDFSEVLFSAHAPIDVGGFFAFCTPKSSEFVRSYKVF